MNQERKNIEADVKKLSEWFEINARELPWRFSGDPYKILLAEIMLQQTTVEACIPYYKKFIERFPTLNDLSRAAESEILSLWSGLGYYSRARNLLKTALILRDSNYEIPSDIKKLVSLPGIGSYTAGAIRSLAFNLPSAMVDANIRRVLGRYLGLDSSTPGAEKIISDASLLFSESGRPEIVNQALMELGSLVCKPNIPDCFECPIKLGCRARKTSKFDYYGSVSKRPATEFFKEVSVIASFGSKILLSRPTDNRWKGMWEFPRKILQTNDDSTDAAVRYMREIFAVELLKPEIIGFLKYQVTRFKTKLTIVSGKIHKEPSTRKIEWLLVNVNELEGLPMPTPMRKIAGLLNSGNSLFW